MARPFLRDPLEYTHLITLVQCNARLLHGRHRLYDVVLTKAPADVYSDRAILIGYTPACTQAGSCGTIEVVPSRGTVLHETKIEQADVMRGLNTSSWTDVSDHLLVKLSQELQIEVGEWFGPAASVVGNNFEGDAGLK